MKNKIYSDVGNIVMSVAKMASPTCQTSHQNELINWKKKVLIN